MKGLIVAWALVVCALVAPPAAATTGACLGPAAQQALRCDDGVVPERVVRHRPPRLIAFRPAPALRPPALPPPERDAAWLERPQPPALDRSRGLLLQELDEVTRLLEATPDDDGDHPRLQRRLAEAWIELAQDLAEEQLRLEMKLDGLAASSPRRASIAADVADVERRVRTARGQGVRYYRRLLAEHPTYCRFARHPRPSDRGCRDEVLFFLGYELEHMDRPVAARRAYFELARDFPHSKYAANAFLAFAELFFEEARHGHPELWATTGRAYGEVIGRVPYGGPRWSYAQYKLAHVRWHEGRPEEALDRFREVVVHATRGPSRAIAEAALRDLVPVYAQAGDATEARRYLEGIAPRRATPLLEQLGRVYLDTGRFAPAQRVFRLLRDHASTAQRCDHQAALTMATLAKDATDVPAMLESLETLDDLRQALDRDRSLPRPVRDRCANATAALLAEAATGWHVEAMGSDGQPGTGDPTVVGAALRAYARLDRSFTAARFRRFAFPRLAGGDEPTLANLRYAYGDLQLQLSDWPGCGATFARAFDADPGGPDAAEALFASAACWQQVFAAQRPAGASRVLDRARMARLEAVSFSPEQTAMLRAFDGMRCHIADAPSTRGQRRAMEMARGHLFFESNHLEAAAIVFRGVALEHPGTSAGARAARLYLESLERLRVHRARPACVDTMAADLPGLAAAFCGDDDHPELCDELAGIERDLDRLRAEAYVALGDRGGPRARAHLKRGAELYLALWHGDGEAACREGRDRCPRYGDVLSNAARAFQAAHLLARAIDTRKLLVAHLPEHPRAHRALLDLGHNHQAIAAYDEAAGWYERFAAARPRSAEAAIALSDAVVLRLGLGQAEAARRDAQRFRLQLGVAHPRQASRIALALARHHATHGDDEGARRALTQARLAIARGPVALRLAADALAARLAHRRGAAAEASRRFRSIVDDTQDLDALRRQVATGDARDWRRILDAAAEARTFAATRLAAKAHTLRPPPYRGPGTRADLQAYLDGPFSRWLTQKRRATARAAAAFAAIPSLHADVAPRWIVGAAAATGDLWAQLADALEATPYPAAWDGVGVVPGVTPPLQWHELRAAYQGALADAVAPFRRAARAAYEGCLTRARAVAHFDARVERAERWLAHHFPRDHRALDELAPPSTHHAPPGHSPPVAHP